MRLEGDDKTIRWTGIAAYFLDIFGHEADRIIDR